MVRKRWDRRVRDVMRIVKVVKKVAIRRGLDKRIRRGRRGRLSKHPAYVYIQAMVLKELCGGSLMEGEVLSCMLLNKRIPKSTLAYWEKHYCWLLQIVLDALCTMLDHLCPNYQYTFLDSTEFTNWHKQSVELFACVRITDSLVPVKFKITRSEENFVREIPKGKGYALADGAYDNWHTLNNLVKKNYLPMVKMTKRNPRGFGARIRNKIFSKDIYRKRSIGEGIFAALSNQFGDRLKTKLIETTASRVLSRCIIYSSKIYLRLSL